VGVSPDPQETSDRFRGSLELPFPLVGDPAREVIRAYRAQWPVLGRVRRITYLVDPDRRVRLAYANEIGMDAHVAQVLKALRTAPDEDRGESR
jgi:peroxiredoxin Q/BCP